MKRLIALVAAVAALSMGGTSSAQAPTNNSSQAVPLNQLQQQLQQGTAIAEGVVDIARVWRGSLPRASQEFDFANTRAFDLQLHSSLKANLTPVNVRVNGGFTTGAVPTRMMDWLDRVQSTGGTVAQCQRDASGIIDIVLALLGPVVSGIRNWLTYRPVRNYNAIVLTTPPAANSTQAPVQQIIFVRRNAAMNCLAGYHQVDWAPTAAP